MLNAKKFCDSSFHELPPLLGVIIATLEVQGKRKRLYSRSKSASSVEVKS
jgi:hypothetical protein